MKIKYTLEAINDLERLRQFVEEKNPHAARRISSDLLDGISNLSLFPKMGLPVNRAPEPESIRDLFIGRHTVRYLTNGQFVIILRIWHSK